MKNNLTFALHKRSLFISLLAVLALSSCKPKISAEIEQNVSTPQIFNIAIAESGMVKLAMSEWGWENISPEMIQIQHKGQPIPIQIIESGGENFVIFFGELNNSRYTNENVYQVSFSNSAGLRMAELPSESTTSLPGDEVIFTEKVEQNLFYSPLAQDGDHWFWEKIISPQTLSINFNLEDLTSGSGEISLAFWGHTFGPEDPDHHVLVNINGQPVADSNWDGQTYHIVKVELAPNSLVNGPNKIEIEVPGNTGTVVDIINLDWIEYSVPRFSNPKNDRLDFWGADQLVQLAGFDGDFTIYDITDAEDVQFSKIKEDHLSFAGKTNRHYLAVGAKGFLTPNKVFPAQFEPKLRSSDLAAEYLIIGPQNLLDAADPLLQLRETQGLTGMSIPIQAIYDQFNGGMPEPEAIQKFLSFASENWNIPPKYVLLLGDTSFDFRGYANPIDGNILPTVMVWTTFGGETGSDIPIANLDDDPWPEIAIGRIPVRSVEQMNIILEKILAYENGLDESNRQQKILAISDGQEANFKTEAQAFLDLFPQSYQTTLLSPLGGDEGANIEIANRIDAGNQIVAYFGHGSIQMWGKDRLFTRERVPDLENSNPFPVMLHITCLSGLFTHPTEESLVESLLWHPKGGAVAVVGPTSLTLPTAQQWLTEAFVNGWVSHSENTRLGDVMLQAWRNIPVTNNSDLDVLNTFLLFGDPALKLPTTGQ